jgi:CRP-like cAMP-binding protein
MVLQTSDLKKYNFFFSLSDGSLESLSQMFIMKSYPRGADVTREGDPADFFYFVKQGRLEVTRNTKYGPARLSVITSGQGFGEIAILTGSMRSASVRALTEVTLCQLRKEDFESIMQREPGFRNALLKRARELSFYDKIKTLQPFVLLDPDKMYALQARMVKKTYSLGEDIIVRGEKGDYYYIVKSGRVAVLKKKKGEDSAQQVAILQEGDGFGEEALIRDDPRNATCRAIEETTVYAIDKVDFDKCLKSEFLDNIFAEDISVQTYREKYVVIDARIPSEYEQEHIRGALSIPVEILRDRYRELDPRKAYVTYCTNDSRGMVAAFLLKNHGFNAKCLRGGISSWDGPVATGQDLVAKTA